MTGSEKTAAALGFFDGMHMGHRAVLESACAAADKYGLVPGAFMIREEPELPKFGGRKDNCLTPYGVKVSLLEEHFGIRRLYTPDFGSIRNLSPEDFFMLGIAGELNAGYVCCGEDFRFGRDRTGDTALLASLCEREGILFEAVPRVSVGGEPLSSTMIRSMIREGDVEGANRLMIRPFTITAPVLHGKRLGRTIGFPTINQELPPFMLHPKRGVYASAVTLGGKDFAAITNIGVKPTVKDDDTENAETHIIGFDGDLYGRSVDVRLLSYIRGERKFGSLGELRKQLEADKEAGLRGVGADSISGT